MEKPKEIGIYLSKADFEHKLGKDTLLSGWDEYDADRHYEFTHLSPDCKELNKVKFLWIASGGEWKGYFPITDKDTDIGIILSFTTFHFVPIPKDKRTKRKAFRGYTNTVPDSKSFSHDVEPVKLESIPKLVFDEYGCVLDIEMKVDSFVWPKKIIICSDGWDFIHVPFMDHETDIAYFDESGDHILKTQINLEKKDGGIKTYDGDVVKIATDRQIAKAKKIAWKIWPDGFSKE